MFLYLSLDKGEKFWSLYEQMPKELRQDKKISIYVIEMYLSSGNISEAKEKEVQVISMACRALKTLQDYSVNLLHDKQVSSEDAYNRTLKLFFNLREERFLGFRLEEQTQNGTTQKIYRSGEHGVGRRDLFLVRKGNPVALLEGIKLQNIEKEKIEEHIEKLRDVEHDTNQRKFLQARDVAALMGF